MAKSCDKNQNSPHGLSKSSHGVIKDWDPQLEKTRIHELAETRILKLVKTRILELAKTRTHELAKTRSNHPKTRFLELAKIRILELAKTRIIMDVISGMATMAMAIPTISFGHRSGHFWP